LNGQISVIIEGIILWYNNFKNISNEKGFLTFSHIKPLINQFCFSPQMLPGFSLCFEPREIISR
jgi:hypothetical protein